MFKKFFTTGMGGFFSPLINAIGLPVISRIYQKEEIGVWSIWICAAILVGGISTCRYELALVLSKRRLEAERLFVLSCALSLLGGLLMGALVAIPWTRDLLVGDNVGLFWVALLPLQAVLLGIVGTLQSWCVRGEAYLLRSISFIALAAMLVGLQTGFGFLLRDRVFDGGACLIAASVLAQAGTFLILLLGLLWRRKLPLLRAPAFSLDGLLRAGKSYKQFLFYSTPYTLFGIIRDRVSVLLFQRFVPLSLLGQYTYTQRILNSPVSLVTSTVQPVVFKEASRRGAENVGRIVTGILFTLVALMTPFLALFLLFSHFWFRLVLGAQWEDAAPMGCVLVWIPATLALCNWMDRILDSMKRQKLMLVLEIFFSSLAVAGMWLILSRQGEFMNAVAFNVLVMVIYNAAILGVVFVLAGYKLSILFKLGGVALCEAVAVWIGASATGPLGGVFLALFVACAALLFGLWRGDLVLPDSFLSFLKKHSRKPSA